MNIDVSMSGWVGGGAVAAPISMISCYFHDYSNDLVDLKLEITSTPKVVVR